jgi:hypothetical protein
MNTEFSELEIAHKEYLSRKFGAAKNISLFDLSVGMDLVAYGKENDVELVRDELDRIQVQYEQSILSWRYALESAEKCLSLRNKGGDNE